MNLVAPFAALDFAPAYRQLQPVERLFVDAYVNEVEEIANNTGQRLLAVLQRPLPDNLDQRTRGMLARPMVRAAIADRVRELSDTMEVSAYKTIKELKALSYSNLGDFMSIGEDGYPDFDLTKCTREQLGAIQSVEITEDAKSGERKLKFRLHDKLGAITTLMKYQGLLESDNPHWRQAKDSERKSIDALPSNVSEETAADAYARVING